MSGWGERVGSATAPWRLSGLFDREQDPLDYEHSESGAPVSRRCRDCGGECAGDNHARRVKPRGSRWARWRCGNCRYEADMARAALIDTALGRERA